MKTRILGTFFLIAALTLSIAFGNAMARVPSERFLGYNTEKVKWTEGNLGKDYFEGDFVSYQLRIDSASKIWGASEFSISYNFFQASSGAIYVDGFDTSATTGFQYSTGDFLPDGTETPPPGWGTLISTPDAGTSYGTGVEIINYMNAWPPGTDEALGSSPSKEHYFTVSGIPWDTLAADGIDHIILFYRAHLALTVIWSNGLEASLPQSLSGTEFTGWTAEWLGAAFATGSSRHFTLQFEGVGDKTIPIPIVQYPPGMVSGYKMVKYCNGVEWVTVPADGWEITLTGTLLGSIPFSAVAVTGTIPWPTGYFEFNGLIEGSYTLTETLKPGYTAESPGASVAFTLARGETYSHTFTNVGPAP